MPWPKSNGNGFLSYKYCKALWTLGARTTMSSKETMRLIEDIITCVNVYNYSVKNNVEQFENDSRSNIYLDAYIELTTYLRYLMIHYNSKVDNDQLLRLNIPLIDYLKDIQDNYEEICIISYNYDIWLERLLILNDLPFCVEGFEHKEDAKIKIIKPHGSISLSFKIKVNKFKPFTISSSDFDVVTQDSSQFDVIYEFKDDYPIVSPIVPPAGDSNRATMSWIETLREKINEKVKLSQSKDKLIIFGLSYWHVDRTEIDEIITNINPLAETVLINPSPPTCFDAVLTSVFQNYIHYTRSEGLKVEIPATLVAST